jgi:hypothetical protein
MHNFLGIFPKFLYKDKNGITGSRKEIRGWEEKIQFLEPGRTITSGKTLYIKSFNDVAFLELNSISISLCKWMFNSSFKFELMNIQMKFQFQASRIPWLCDVSHAKKNKMVPNKH